MAGDAGEGLLPPGFLLGVATAGYEVEGGFNGPGQPANNWATWERTGRVQPSGDAAGFWRQPEVCFERAAGLGADAFQMSIEWARVEPADGEVDEGALDRYAELVAAAAAHGLEPVLTLHHGTHPWWLGEEFWLTPGSPDRFARHAATVARHLGARCRRWVTVHRPLSLAAAGWLLGTHPPGRRLAASDALAVVDNLLTAHVLAYQALHAVRPDAVVTVDLGPSAAYELDRLYADLLVAPAHGVERSELAPWLARRRAVHRASVDPGGRADPAAAVVAALSPYGPEAPGLAGRLRRPTPGRLVDAVYAGPAASTLDAVALAWSDPAVSAPLGRPGGRSSAERHRSVLRAPWDEALRPELLAPWVSTEASRHPGRPILVHDQGMASRTLRGRGYPRRDGATRPAYLRSQLAAVLDALAAGAPVAGYLHHSLVDGYAWGSFEPRTGLFAMDRDQGVGPRWCDRDALGDDAAGAWRRLVEGLRHGDRSVFDAPGP